MLDREWCLLCQSWQLGPCRTPDDAAQCPMQRPETDDSETVTRDTPVNLALRQDALTNQGDAEMTKTRFVIARTSAATGRVLYLTESRTAGVSFEAPGNTATGVGVANLKTWATEAGAQRWIDARPSFKTVYSSSNGMTLTIQPAT